MQAATAGTKHTARRIASERFGRVGVVIGTFVPAQKLFVNDGAAEILRIVP